MSRLEPFAARHPLLFGLAVTLVFILMVLVSAILGILNSAGYLNLTSNVTQGTSASWLWLSLAMLPLAICGLYLLRDVRRFYPPATQTLKITEAESMYPKFTD